MVYPPKNHTSYEDLTMFSKRKPSNLQGSMTNMKSRRSPFVRNLKKVRSILHATTPKTELIYEELKPLWLIFKLYGLFPFQKPSPGVTRFEAISLTMIYFLCFYTIFAVITVMVVLHHLSQLQLTNTSFEDSISIYNSLIVFTIHFWLGPSNWLQARKMVRYFESWWEFQKIFLKVTGEPLYCRLKKKSVTSVFGSIVTSFFLFLFEHFVNDHFDVSGVGVLTPLVYSYSISLINIHASLWLMLNIVLQNSAVALLNSFRKNAIQPGSPAGAISEHRVAWCALNNISRQLGYSCTWSFGATFVSWFVIMLLSSYGLVAAIIRSRLDLSCLVFALHTFVGFFPIFSTCMLAHSTTTKLEDNFRELVSDSISMLREEQEMELKLFLLVIEANPSIITIGGFFTINRQSLISIISTVMTYLVVMVQMRPRSPPTEPRWNVTLTH